MRAVLTLVFILFSVVLMAQGPSLKPGFPAALRQGDHTELAVRVVNASDSEVTGQIQLELFDERTSVSVDGWFINSFPNQYFTVAAHDSDWVRFPVQVPRRFYSSLRWRLSIQSGNLTKHDEGKLQVLPEATAASVTQFIRLAGEDTAITLPEITGKEMFEKLSVEGSSAPIDWAARTLAASIATDTGTALATWLSIARVIMAKKLFEKYPHFISPGYDSSLIHSSTSSHDTLSSLTPQWRKDINNLAKSSNSSQTPAQLYGSLQHWQHADGSFGWPGRKDADPDLSEYILLSMGRMRKLEGETNSLHPVTTRLLKWLDNEILGEGKADLRGVRSARLLLIRSYFITESGSPERKAWIDLFAKTSKAPQPQPQYDMLMLAWQNCNGMNDIPQRIALRGLTASATRPSVNARSGGWWEAAAELAVIQGELALTSGGSASSVLEQLARLRQPMGWTSEKASMDACYILLRLCECPPSGGYAFSLDNRELLRSQPYDVAKIYPEQLSTSSEKITIKKIDRTNKNSPFASAFLSYHYFKDSLALFPGLRLQKRLYLSSTKSTALNEAALVRKGQQLKAVIIIQTDRDFKEIELRNDHATGLSFQSLQNISGAPVYYQMKNEAGSDRLYFPNLPKGQYRLEFVYSATLTGSFPEPGAILLLQNISGGVNTSGFTFHIE